MRDRNLFKALYYFLFIFLSFINYDSKSQSPLYQLKFSDIDSTMYIRAHAVNSNASMLVGYYQNTGCMCKVSANGNLSWCKKLVGDTTNYLKSIIEINNYYYVITDKGVIIKTDQNANVIWSRQPLIDSDPEGIKLINLGDSVIYAAINGYSQWGNYFSTVARLDTSGTIAWIKKFDYGSPEDNRIYDMYACPDGTILIGGQCASPNFGKGFLMRWSSEGQFIWSKDIKVLINHISQLNSGHICIGGGNVEVSLFDWYGNRLWGRFVSEFGVTGNPTNPVGMVTTADNRMILTSTVQMGLTPVHGCAMYIYDTTGTCVSAKLLYDSFAPVSMQTTTDGRISIVGMHTNGNSAYIPWIAMSDTAGNSGGCSMISDGIYDGSLPYIPDTFTMSYFDTLVPVVNPLFSFTNITVSPTVLCQGVTDIQLADQQMQLQLMVYPNPVISNLTFRTDVAEEINIRIFDSRGNVIKVISKVADEGININVDDLSGGIYFIDAVINNRKYSGRFIKI